MFTLYIGSKFDRNGRPVRNAGAKLTAVKREALARFGGYSVSTVFGGWNDAAGRAIEEKSIRLEVSELRPDYTPEVYRFAQFCAICFCQSAVLVSSPLGDVLVEWNDTSQEPGAHTNEDLASLD